MAEGDAALTAGITLSPVLGRYAREIGERILAPIIRNAEVLAAIRGHHERLDGKGYPTASRGPTSRSWRESSPSRTATTP